MRFLQPAQAIWFLGIPLAFAAWYLHVHAKRRFRHRLDSADRLRAISRLSTPRRDRMALVAAVLAVGFVTLALMRPQVMLERQRPDYERQDLILILDRSVSMHAEDIEPSRFSRAIGEIKSFLAQKPDAIGRVGLVAFSGTALIVSHMTSDVGNLFFYLDWIQEDDAPQFGTDIGAALASARELARKDGRSTRKIFLILSDGDDQGRQLQAELAALRGERTPVYTIGIGSAGNVPIPAASGGGRAGVLKDDQGRALYTRFSETTLREIAVFTGGRYFRSITGRELADAMRNVVERERTLLGYTAVTEYQSLYRECLMAGAFFLLIVLLTL